MCSSRGISLVFIFFFFKTSSVPFYTGLYFLCAIGPNLQGFDGGFSKIIPSKSCLSSLRSVGCHQVGADIDLVVGKLHRTLLFPAVMGRCGGYWVMFTIDFVAIFLSECDRDLNMIASPLTPFNLNRPLLKPDLNNHFFNAVRTTKVILPQLYWDGGRNPS